jgi:hypothetical protein
VGANGTFHIGNNAFAPELSFRQVDFTSTFDEIVVVARVITFLRIVVVVDGIAWGHDDVREFKSNEKERRAKVLECGLSKGKQGRNCEKKARGSNGRSKM